MPPIGGLVFHLIFLLTMQMSNTTTAQERAAWEQFRQVMALSLGLGVLGSLVFGPWGFLGGYLLGRGLSKTDRLHY